MVDCNRPSVALKIQLFIKETHPNSQLDCWFLSTNFGKVPTKVTTASYKPKKYQVHIMSMSRDWRFGNEIIWDRNDFSTFLSAPELLVVLTH